MSTKIYNGYRLPMMTLKELTEFTKMFRKKAEKKAGELISIYFANEVAEMVDDLLFLDEETYIRRHLLYEVEKKKLREQEKLAERGFLTEEKDRIKLTFDAYPYRSLYTAAYRKAQERYDEIQRTQYRDPDVDFDCNACFIPLEDKILALFYTEQKELETLWKACSEVRYYGYWNNSMPDEDASNEEWEQRERDWEEALPGVGIPMENGICADFVKGFVSRQFITAEMTLQHIPKVIDRAKRVAEEHVMDRKYKEIQSDLPPDAEPGLLDIYHQTRRWMRTAEGKQAMKEEIEKVLPLLTCKIKKAHLFTKVSKLIQGELDEEESEVKKTRRTHTSLRGKARKQGRGKARKMKGKPRRIIRRKK